MSPHRPAARTALLLSIAAAAVLLAGCADAGGLRGAGPTPTAVGPVRLWPGLPPVTAPPFDYGESDTERVPGVSLPDGDVRKTSPVAVLQAEVAAHPDQVTGADGMYEETARAIRDCGRRPKGCPVLRPYYRDLTGDGKDELIVGFTMPDQQVGLRCYMPENGGLTRIMSTSDQVVRVELAGRDLIVRVVSAGIPGYEYRTAWSWDAQQRTMLPKKDEIIRVKPAAPPGTPPPGDDSAAPEEPAPPEESEQGPSVVSGGSPGASVSGASPAPAVSGESPAPAGPGESSAPAASGAPDPR
ncbi:hypothetical protein NX801_01055 [Streptomyces sp. LP05-1]|uniref:Lipoprotein n=1 Tax=Streptomyces pyxinae TaxID=2970734 RepID=A0ABT2CBY1_9ACTN|nr:hypothetical protein [Streptomyces sp. LP05-1]MCS0634276.1 hypothetical protein [Streptomyces sp. LP05-1]